MLDRDQVVAGRVTPEPQYEITSSPAPDADRRQAATQLVGGQESSGVVQVLAAGQACDPGICPTRGSRELGLAPVALALASVDHHRIGVDGVVGVRPAGPRATVWR